MIFVKHIIRYPIKGLNGEYLRETKLSKSSTILGDRIFAFAKHDNNINEYAPIYMKKTNFLALVKEEKLSLLNSKLNLKNKNLTLSYNGKVIFSGSLDNKIELDKLSTCMSKFLEIDLEKKPRLIKDKSNTQYNQKHSFSDIPDKAISFINLNTVKDFENKLNKEVNHIRFRGNIIFEGIKAWEEFNWLGKIIQIEDVKFEIFRRTKRCAATNVNPKNGSRDLNIPNQLQKIYGHYDLGVYGKVVNEGIIKINDEIKIKSNT